MKKKNLLIIILILVISFFKIEVEAASCTTEEKKALKQEAQAIEIIAILDSEEDVWHEHFYGVNFTNWSDKFYILDSKGTTYEYYSSYTPESIYGQYQPGSIVTFKIYGAVGKKCAFEHLSTIRVTFDHYNEYYLSPLCEGIEEFELCKKNYSGKIQSAEWFEEQIKKYKESLEEKIIKEQCLRAISKIYQRKSRNHCNYYCCISFTGCLCC